ncbi:uncharacterized protein LOC133187416 [Saccostrea echinata]|uniref:uncharacterized protein LOC133187416 n=1 Tax=Saccostrea echinata TaxID=191078 RepID=UPI002A81E8A1|nr:uncharacterized protein LOC133187416 [Saccostrea echinata]
MNRQNLADLGAYTAIGCASTFMGSAYYVNFVQTPAMMQVKDTKAVRALWKEMFLRAKRYQSGFAMTSAAAAVLVGLHEQSKYRWLWFGSAAAIIAVVPWTFIVMMPDIKRLLEDDVIDKEGEQWVRDKIRLWSRRHGVRTFLSDLSANLMLAAVYMTRM